MKNLNPLVALLLLAVITGCSSTNDAVSKGPFQKRKYQSGWHVDVNFGKKSRSTSSEVESATALKRESQVPSDAIRSLDPPTEPSLVYAAETPDGRSDHTVGHADIDVHASTDQVDPVYESSALRRMAPVNEPKFSPSPSAPDGDQNDRTNGMAIAGFVCSLFFPILGLVFSAIALGQIKRRGGRGRGLATAGLVISIVTLVLILALL